MNLKLVRQSSLILVAIVAFLLAVSLAHASTQITRVTPNGVAVVPDSSVPEIGAEPTPPEETLCSPIKHDQIGLDGCPEDWFAAGIEPVIVDAYEDFPSAGGDILTIRIADRVDPKDGKRYVYGLVELAAPPGGSIFALINADRRRNTGCSSNIGGEFGVTMTPNEPNPAYRYYIGDARDCGWGSADYPGALQVQTRDRFMEFRVPASILLRLSRGPLLYLEFFFMNDITEVGRYYLRGVGGSTQGLLPFGAVCWNQTTGQMVSVPAGETVWNCPEYGFRASPGNQVFMGVTGIVPPPAK